MTGQREASLGTEGHGTRSWAGATAEQGRCGQEDSGARSEAVTSSEPGWAWGQGSWPLGWPALGVPGPGAGCRGARYLQLDGSGVLAAEPGASCPPRAGAGTLGDLAGGPGRRGQLLPLMSQGHE